jgi:hypothetical protein
MFVQSLRGAPVNERGDGQFAYRRSGGDWLRAMRHRRFGERFTLHRR